MYDITKVFPCSVLKWLDIFSRGYFPKGGGEVHIRTQPVKHIQCVQMTDIGEITAFTGRAFVAGVLPIKVSHS